MCNINPPCSSIPCGPWGPCDGSKFITKICISKPKPCPPPPSIYCVPHPLPCPPPCTPLPPICGIYEQAIRKPRLPCPPPCPPRYLEFGHPPLPPCPPPCPPRKAPWPVCLPCNPRV
ncbi:small proline-rich protein 2E-like [Vespula maculifrons]|uniref:Uncharacterized protein n=2 Tax=Vespula TaxID=7451 RepID=A0A834K538_VESVU|nr:small proline-rich protein 2E-like [Vespula vulgaris]KAF7398549.1 hypothetical protein HZH66_006446 [Vespula vulgaris]